MMVGGIGHKQHSHIIMIVIINQIKQRIHVIPFGGNELVHHASVECWCYPVIEENGAMAIHNAKDLREKRERQGIQNNGQPWGLVYENVEVAVDET